MGRIGKVQGNLRIAN